jgi:hypothetical protein
MSTAECGGMTNIPKCIAMSFPGSRTCFGRASVDRPAASVCAQEARAGGVAAALTEFSDVATGVRES